METDDRIELHHKTRFKDGGSNKLENLMAIHSECHKQVTYNFDRKAKNNGGSAGPPAGHIIKAVWGETFTYGLNGGKTE
jgi:HNH endonuclease